MRSFSKPFFFLLFALTTTSSNSFSTTSRTNFARRTRGRVCQLNSQTSQDGVSTSKQNKPKGSSKKGSHKQQHRGPNSGAAPQKRSRPSTSQFYVRVNQEVTKQETAIDLLGFLSSQKGALTTTGGGGALNNINFATALHRIARHISYNNFNRNKNDGGDDATYQKNDRSRVLTDPRFALMLCSTAEAMAGKTMNRDGKPILFGSRELSNMAWAIAKLKLAPPKNVIPVDTSDAVEERLKTKSAEVRNSVYEVAKQRQAGGSSESSNASWVPALSELSGLVLDTISHRVVDVDPSLFRLQEWANLLWALATSDRADAEVFGFIISSLMQGMDDASKKRKGGDSLSPQEWSNSLWALATSGVFGPEEDLLPFVANLMESHPTFLEDFKPQEMSNTVWGVATILSKRPGQPTGEINDAALTICRHVARQLVKRQGDGFKSQELTNTAWAFATLGFGILTGDSTAEKSDYTFLVSEDPDGDQQLSRDAIQVALDNAKQGLRRFRSQELNNLTWVMARMGVKDFELKEMIGAEICNPRRKINAQDIGTTLWGLATAEFYRPETYRAIVSRWTPEMARRAKPQELSNTLWALATADVSAKYIDAFDTTILAPRQREAPRDPRADPVISTFALGAQELMRRPDHFKPQEIKDILWAFSRNGIRHPELFRSMAAHLMGSGEDIDVTGRGLNEFSVQGVCNTAWAFARQAQLGAETMQRFNSKTLLPKSSGRLSHYTILFIDIGETLLHKLFYNIAEVDLRLFENLTKLRPQDLANTVWAFAIVGLHHARFLDAVGVELERRILAGRNSNIRFTSQEVTNTLWALATLNHPIPGLMEKVAPAIVRLGRRDDLKSTNSIAQVWMRQELANLAWVCAVFGEYPKELVEMLYMGLVGIGDDPNPSAISKCFGDSGITPTIVMSLAYLHIAMDLELDPKETRLQLPEGFPQGWESKGRGSSTSTNSGRSTIGHPEVEGVAELMLTRSRMQQMVSEAFSRIGFDHVEEHVIDMKSLAKDYGIQVSPVSTEILSLDIANLPRKLGIEVDGPGHFITYIDDGWDPDRNSAVSQLSNGKTEYTFDWTAETSKVNGPTALKIRMLEQMGWKIYNIPFWSWTEVQGDAKSEEEYCQHLLNE